jgi:molybdate transport system substrate-binding protein
MRWLGVLLGLVAVAGCKNEPGGSTRPAASGEAGPTQVRIAAAADLQFVLADLAKRFEQEHSDIRVSVTYGSSGNFFSQLSNKAPFDIFLSADASYPQKLVDQGLAKPAAMFPYARGRIVLWALKGGRIDVAARQVGSLTDPAVRKIAIANPEHAPYGRAAVAAMRSAGVYERVKDRLILGENISQTAQFVSSGSADVGIVALSLALAPSMADKGVYFEIPVDSYPPIEQAGVILNWAADARAAEAFRDYLISDAGRATLARFGFSDPVR